MANLDQNYAYESYRGGQKNTFDSQNHKEQTNQQISTKQYQTINPASNKTNLNDRSYQTAEQINTDRVSKSHSRVNSKNKDQIVTIPSNTDGFKYREPQNQNLNLINNTATKGSSWRPQRTERDSGLTGKSSSKYSNSHNSTQGQGSKKTQYSMMIPVDIECLSETQLRELKEKIDTKLKEKVNSISSKVAIYAKKSANGSNSISKTSNISNLGKNQTYELNDNIQDNSFQINSGSMDFKKIKQKNSIPKSYTNLLDKKSTNSSIRKEKIKNKFKFCFERSNLPVATGMSENLIYKPQNIDTIAEKLAELQQTDTESSMTQSQVFSEKLVDISDSSLNLEDHFVKNKHNFSQQQQQQQIYNKTSLKKSIEMGEEDLMYSHEFDFKDNTQARTIKNGQIESYENSVLTESSLDLSGVPIKSDMLLYTPLNNNQINFKNSKDYKKESYDKNSDSVIKSGGLFLKKRIFKNSRNNKFSEDKYPQNDVFKMNSYTKKPEDANSVSKKLSFKPPKSLSNQKTQEPSTLVRHWNDLAKTNEMARRDSLQLDLDMALLADRGGSDDELETNKTVKMINKKIKDFELEFAFMSGSR